MKTTKCNLSPVFGLYRDPDDDVGKAVADLIDGDPDYRAMLDSVENKVWIITDDNAIRRVTDSFSEKNVYIADGHHRYNTALMYRDWLAEQSGGSLPPDHRPQFALVTLGSMDDPGNLILPTHRVLVDLQNVTLDKLMAVWSEGCESVADHEAADMSIVCGRTGDAKHVLYSNRGILRSLEPDKCAAWCDLDVAYLHRFLLDELFTKRLAGREAPSIRYIKSEQAARETAKQEHGIALISKATTMEQLRAVSEGGDVMPQKSTYFFPKVATGLTINPLYD